MQHIITLTILACTAGLAAATNLQCAAPGQPRFTEARLANIIDQLRSSDYVVRAEPHGPCAQLGCTGGTGAYICSEANELFSSKTLGDTLDSKFKDCYGDTPQSTKPDNVYAPAFEWYDDGFRVFVQGSKPC